MPRTLNPILLPFCLDCRNNTLLVYLDLSRNGIGDKCASDIFQARLPAPVRSSQTYSQRGSPLHGVKAPGDRSDDMCRVCIRFAVELCLPSGPDACQPASLVAGQECLAFRKQPRRASHRSGGAWRGVAWRGGAWRGVAWPLSVLCATGHCLRTHSRSVGMQRVALVRLSVTIARSSIAT